MVIAIHLEGEADLLLVAHALDQFRLLLGAAERGQQQRGQDRNDGDDDKEFDESEKAFVAQVNLLYRRLPVGWASASPRAFDWEYPAG